MSAVVHHDYVSAAATSTVRCQSAPLKSWPLKRLVIALVGCAVMAMSGTGVANYLDTSSVTGADAAPADAAPLNN